MSCYHIHVYTCVCEKYIIYARFTYLILAYSKHGRVHAMKSEQHDDSERSNGLETQSKSRQQVD